MGAQIILSVPCCQKEIRPKIKSQDLEPMLSYGIVKERFASLATDSIRANILSILGYKVDLLEFIDMENTPKNILIRAVKAGPYMDRSKLKAYRDFKEFLGLDNIYIEESLKSQVNIDLNEGR